MTSTHDRTPSADTPSPARRVLNRIASPFNNRVRNIVDFEVRPDDPHKQYSPGDLVTGSVCLRVTKPTRVTHLVVRLHGYVQVYKNPTSPGDGFRPPPLHLHNHRGNKHGEYFGNGFASLFEDEVVLCGDGRLAEGAYQFNFELEFPDRDLPSSIEFERGTICYLITATMTRPSTMSPVLTSDHKIYFMERIDIGFIYPPKARTITLDPVSRKLRPRVTRRLTDTTDAKGRKTSASLSPTDGDRASEVSSNPYSRPDPARTISPDQSEVSFQSGTASADQASSRGSQGPSSPCGSEAVTSRASVSKSSLTPKVVTVTIESQTGGCLRGDILPVKIVVNHTKQVKSLHGVIVTLYRVARVDMRPAIPLGPTERGKDDRKFEEYYPKSLTGLGGLSLSGAGSTHVFRKDLSQTMAPLYVDPHTLTAEINTKVRVPDEAFPTISTVPGQMISFKYYLEVVLDVSGRLSGHDRSVSALPGLAGTPSLQGNADNGESERSAFTPFGSTIVDTTPVRRNTSVVTSTFEVVVGTKNSVKKGKRKLEAIVQPPDEPQSSPQEQQQPQPPAEVAHPENDEAWHYDPYGYDWYGYPAYYDPNSYQEYAGHQYRQPLYAIKQNAGPEGQGVPPPPHVPIPQLADESQMSEKERIQQAETRLLPSAPPGMEDQATVGALSFEPTAPYIPEESNIAAHSGGSGGAVTAPLIAEGTVVPQDSVLGRSRSDGPLDEPSTATNTLDEKDELRRQQLQAQASSPPLDDDEEAIEVAAHGHAPTAPAFVEDDDHTHDVHDSHGDATGSATLPRYER